MAYKVEYNPHYDFISEGYHNKYPKLHPYPATMLPQIGIKLFEDLDLRPSSMLDPYCGTGSSFVAGLENGVKSFYGADINPLARLISTVRFTLIDQDDINHMKQTIKELIATEQIASPSKCRQLFKNQSYWFSQQVLDDIYMLSEIIAKATGGGISSSKQLVDLAFVNAIRSASYVRKGEFKRYRMTPKQIAKFKPDMIELFLKHFDSIILSYEQHYLQHAKEITVSINDEINNLEKYDVVLTSPPYGDSKTTVAYGEFSRFANEYLAGFNDVGNMDRLMMGGINHHRQFHSEVIDRLMLSLKPRDEKRSQAVYSFYSDLAHSISDVSDRVNENGTAIYVVGNRRVCGEIMPTDQFIAEQLELNGLRHEITIERLLSAKAMPILNAPSNVIGEKQTTMNKEYIVIAKKG